MYVDTYIYVCVYLCMRMHMYTYTYIYRIHGFFWLGVGLVANTVSKRPVTHLSSLCQSFQGHTEVGLHFMALQASEISLRVQV